jgi:hypothetical protein
LRNAIDRSRIDVDTDEAVVGVFHLDVFDVRVRAGKRGGEPAALVRPDRGVGGAVEDQGRRRSGVDVGDELEPSPGRDAR